MAKMRRDQLAQATPTRCERALYALLDELLGPGGWARQYLMFDRWTVDACVPDHRLILQADGDYWHGHLAQARAHKMVEANMRRDRAQDAYVAKAGWKTLRLWEHELLGDPDSCRERLIEALGVPAH